MLDGKGLIESKEKCEKPLIIFSAGGKGTRIQSLNSTVPKPMIPIAGKPIMQWGMEGFVRQGYRKFVITVSHMAERIESYFGDGSKYGCNITYFHEEAPLGNAGALYKLWELNRLDGSFFYCVADAIFSIDADLFFSYHQERNALASSFCHPNSHPYDSALLVADGEGKVVQWLNKEDDRPKFYHNCVNAGLQILSVELLKESGIDPSTVGSEPGQRKVDLDRDVLKPLISTGRIMAYNSSEYCKDAGTPERFHGVEEDITKGLVEAKNLQRPQRAIFLSLYGTVNGTINGTINKYNRFVCFPFELELLPFAADAIRMINDSGYLAIIVTDQPAMEEGEVAAEQLDLIYAKLETELGKQGAYIDAFGLSFHHPDKKIDLKNSWMIADSWIDLKAGQNEGCKTVLMNGEGAGRSDRSAYFCSPDHECGDLLEAVKMILS